MLQTNDYNAQIIALLAERGIMAHEEDYVLIDRDSMCQAPMNKKLPLYPSVDIEIACYVNVLRLIRSSLAEYTEDSLYIDWIHAARTKDYLGIEVCVRRRPII